MGDRSYLYSAHAMQMLERGVREYSGQSMLALALTRYKHKNQPDCSQQNISKWAKMGYVPCEWVVPLELAINARAGRTVTDRARIAPVIFSDKNRGRRR